MAEVHPNGGASSPYCGPQFSQQGAEQLASFPPDAATVQDFLERYEVGETVGVGGRLGGLQAGVITGAPPNQAWFSSPAGFAVVKKGKDKRTGEPVAIKVRSSPQTAPMHDGDPCCNTCACTPPQVVDKSRYAAGDNSLEREIQVLLKVRPCGNPRLLCAGLARHHRAIAALQVVHPNCIKLYDVYITPRKVYIVTELVTGGELLDRCVATVARSISLATSRQHV